jgi:hypothetical protein
MRYSEGLAEAGVEPLMGCKGDYDNALADWANGLYKAELIHRRAPWKTKEAVELATLEWVSWLRTTACSNPSARSHRPRQKQNTTGNAPVRLPRRPDSAGLRDIRGGSGTAALGRRLQRSEGR